MRAVACFLVVACAVLSGGLLSSPALAHPPDTYYHLLTLSPEPDAFRLRWELYAGPLSVPAIWSEADADGDGDVSEAEARDWAATNATNLVATLNGEARLAWRVESVEWPQTPAGMLAGEETVVMHLAAGWPAPLTGRQEIDVVNEFLPETSLSYFSAVDSGETGFIQDLAADRQRASLVFDAPAGAGFGAMPADASAAVIGAPIAHVPEMSGTYARLSGLIRSEEATPAFYLAALAIAAALGALHALTPGHGKAVVAAYLVGSRGTARHALALGGVTTFTHTGSVLALGLVALLASRFILPNDLFPWLEALSGLMIVLLGGWLLWRRLGQWRRASAVDGPHGGHDHAHHDGDESHDHHHHHHLTAAEGRVAWRSLAALGISGGLTPCPDAIAILLLAVAIQRIGLGLALIVSFSAGLALVLIVLGIVMVRSRGLFDRSERLNRAAPFLPTVSALVVLALGIGLTVRALA